MKHRHAWTELLRDQVAYFSKRNVKEDAVYFEGNVQMCNCGAMLFVPREAGCRPVPCTLEKK